MFGIPTPASLYKAGALAAVAMGCLLGSYFYGLHTGHLAGKAAIAAYAAQRDKEEADLLGVNNTTAERIVVQTVTQTQIVHDKQIEIQHEIQTIPDNSTLSPDWVRLYDESIGVLPSATSGTPNTVAGPEAISAKDALSGITENNASCQVYRDRAEALMEYEKNLQQEIAKANKTK